MQKSGAILVAAFCLVSAYACSRTPAPSGRWEGAYQSGDVMILVRLEIDSKGEIFLTAPDAMDVTADDRQAVRARLAAGLSAAWSNVQPRSFDFDGRVFRKPGGVAPQLEWDADRRQMTAIIYPGLRPSIRIPLRAVNRFSDDPGPG